ncbi:unnamed protein product [Cochlearia groenlandica]
MEGRGKVNKINGGDGIRRKQSNRPMPKRGQVKVGILLGFANSFVSILSSTRNLYAP